nr:immunoglobulin heavy chain junction region [Macaca mulatta]MOY25722.1 immunoglobulin heavy chain junction region [Macaca mulatta]MOY25874.1 immunoglobulin heavy chain junction region [Macaca mulatta]MOY27168.1 immunoglobulin heavy chain junction region [Macaca mulatta]MOY29002.1 immunoglobulin heavy chain junction region [Macaca mulatta]
CARGPRGATISASDYW